MGNRRNTYRITYYEQQKLKITVLIYYTTSVSRALPNSQLLHSDILAEAVSAGDVVEVVWSGQVGDVAASSLHVARHLVSGVVVPCEGDRLQRVELPSQPTHVRVHRLVKLVRNLGCCSLAAGAVVLNRGGLGGEGGRGESRVHPLK